MTRLLERLLGRLPIGWLQLTHNRARLYSAIAGVAFANVLVIVQLGIAGSMTTATLQQYAYFDADIMISAEDANSMTEGGNVARQRLFQALADPGVTGGVSLFVANLAWERPKGQVLLQIFGVDPHATGFLNPEMAHKVAQLPLLNAAIIDRNTRGLDAEMLGGIRPHSPETFEYSGKTISLVDSFSGGGGFGTDGYLFVSDQTFLNLFGKRISGAPDHILLQVARGEDVGAVVARLRDTIGDKSLRIRSFADARAEDLAYQNTQRPTGLIFGFGVVIGILVGIVIVYQVLSTDVAAHLREYATFKAMGYSHKFFLGIVLEEAMILAIFGFAPGVIVASGLLSILHAKTGLPVAMTAETAIMVFVGTLAACALSGAIATRRLAAADPADLF
ncbi:MAG: FtsX-like permease family protein [Rhodobacteraceae bacterium]|nr:FtsX-like permease family protein [Paracoccaceae bacterium]